MSPTALDMKCPVKGCKLPLCIVLTDNEYVICECANGHRRQYTRGYFRRFQSPDNVRGDLAQECPKCHKPIRERSRTAQNDAKGLGRIECSCCQTALLYDSNTQKWVIADD